MLIGTGTPQDQWREAGIEVYFGHLSAQDLHDFGTKLIAEIATQLRDECEENLNEAEHDDEDYAELEEDLRKAKKKIKRLRRALKDAKSG